VDNWKLEAFLFAVGVTAVSGSLDCPASSTFSAQKLLQSSVSLNKVRGSEILLGQIRLSLASICYSADFSSALLVECKQSFCHLISVHNLLLQPVP
jgi:hypothetical protein